MLTYIDVFSICFDMNNETKQSLSDLINLYFIFVESGIPMSRGDRGSTINSLNPNDRGHVETLAAHQGIVFQPLTEELISQIEILLEDDKTKALKQTIKDLESRIASLQNLSSEKSKEELFKDESGSDFIDI